MSRLLPVLVRSTRAVRALCLAGVAALGACGPGEAPPQIVDSQLIVAASWPVGYLAERIAGPEFEVQMPIPEDADPLHWSPDRPALEAMNRAGLIVLNGAAFEPWAERASLPLSRVVRTAKVFEDEWIERSSATHSHGPRGAHSHGTIDPHTWLDPLLAKAQAGAIRDALSARHPDQAAGFEERFRSLSADLDGLNKGWSEFSQGLDDRRVLAAHGAYDYLARRHGWTVDNFDLDPTQVPGDQDLVRLGSAAKSGPAFALLWETQPTPAVAQAAAKATGLPNLVLDPAEVRSAADAASGRTYLDVQRENLQELLQASQSSDQ